jgi:hypothetical protein
MAGPGAANRILMEVEVTNAIANARLQQTQKQIQALADEARAFQNKMLGVGLSFLFTGMAIKRMADEAMRSLFTTMQLASGETSEFNVLTNQLRANWEFFKFTLMDALMQSGLFAGFIGFLISVVTWFNELSPTMKVALVTGIILLIVLGGAMMIAGQTMLFLIGLSQLFGVQAALSFAKVIGIVLVLAAVIFMLWALWNTDGNKAVKTLTTIGLVLIGIGLIVMMLGGVFVGGLMLAIGLTILAAIAFKEELGMGFAYLMKGAVELGRVIVQTLISPLTALVLLYNSIAPLLGRKKVEVPFDTVNKIADDIDAKINARIDELQEQKANRGSIMDRLGFGEFQNKQDELKNQLTGNSNSNSAPVIQQNNYIDVVNQGNEKTKVGITETMELANEELKRYGGSTLS